MVAVYPSCFQGGRTSAPAVVTTCGLRIGDGDFTGLIGEVEILPAGETDLTGEGVGALTCLTGDGDCLTGDGDSKFFL